MPANQEILLLIENTITKHGRIDLPAEGNSMFPFIRQGDICRFITCDAAMLKKGDIVLYHSQAGHLIAHRFYERRSVNYQLQYFFKGDTNLCPDAPVDQQQVLGKLIHVQKHKSIIHMTDLTAHLWRAMIFTFPKLSGILRIYLNRKHST